MIDGRSIAASGFRAGDNSHALPRLVGVLLVQHRRRRQTVGPPGSIMVKELPPSSLDSPLSLVLQPLPPDDAERRLPDKRPFARTLNGQAPPRYSPLDSGSPRNNLGLARSPFVLRTFPPRARETRGPLGEGVRRLACFHWRSQQYAPRPSPTATTAFVTGFRPRCVCLSRLLAGTVGGSVCWRLRVVSPAACLPLFSCRFAASLKG